MRLELNTEIFCHKNMEQKYWDKVQSAADDQRSSIPTVTAIASTIQQRNHLESVAVVSGRGEALTSRGDVPAGFGGLIMSHPRAF